MSRISPLSHFYKRSNPIASYCLHLSPVLPLLEEIGSPWRNLFFLFGAPSPFTWNVWARRDGGASWHCVVPIFWSSVISDWTYWIIDSERECVFLAYQGFHYVSWTCMLEAVTLGLKVGQPGLLLNEWFCGLLQIGAVRCAEIDLFL